MKTLEWLGQNLILLNQTLLPNSIEFIDCRDWRRVAEAIRRLEVRGAPAIGAAAAFGFVLGVQEIDAAVSGDQLRKKLTEIATELRQTRPTAVNLFWAMDRMEAVIQRVGCSDFATLLTALEAEAKEIAAEDCRVNESMSRYGAALFNEPIAILTHCNAGALATVAVGTALGVIRQAWTEKKVIRVFADETRPLLQGARLTAWELTQDQIPVTLITDNMAGWVMKNNMVQAVIVGADRIAANGDVANKIGTYSVAVLAKEHGIPFYVAAPRSTFDFTIATGADIPIEERSRTEVTSFGGVNVAPPGIDVFNPAFDVTPHNLVAAIITEHGVLTAPYTQSISWLHNANALL